MENNELDLQIEAVLDKLRPFLQREGGGIEYYGCKDGIVYVRMSGACAGCMYEAEDLSTGVEIMLLEEVPGVIRVSGSGEIPEDVMEAYLKRKEEQLKNN